MSHPRGSSPQAPWTGRRPQENAVKPLGPRRLARLQREMAEHARQLQQTPPSHDGDQVDEALLAKQRRLAELALRGLVTVEEGFPQSGVTAEIGMKTVIDPMVPTERWLTEDGVKDIAERLNSRALVAFTSSGETARRLARLQPPQPEEVGPDGEEVLRQRRRLHGVIASWPGQALGLRRRHVFGIGPAIGQGADAVAWAPAADIGAAGHHLARGC